MKNKKILLIALVIIQIVAVSLCGCREHECIGEWKTTKAPSIISAGEQELTCDECGKIQTQQIPALGVERGQELLKGKWSSTKFASGIQILIEIDGNQFDAYFRYTGEPIKVSDGTYAFTETKVVFTTSSGEIWDILFYQIENETITKLISMPEDGSEEIIYLKD